MIWLAEPKLAKPAKAGGPTMGKLGTGRSSCPVLDQVAIAANNLAATARASLHVATCVVEAAGGTIAIMAISP
jgi:hypothetical protein